MSTPVSSSEIAVEETVSSVRALRVAIDKTVTAYYEKEEEQTLKMKKMNEALKTLRRQRRPAPARSIEDDPSLFDEGRYIPTLIMTRRLSRPQTTLPVYRVFKQWEIPDLKKPLHITEIGTMTRQMPSIIKASSMQEQLPLDHPWVLDQVEDILRGLDAMRFALREV